MKSLTQLASLSFLSMVLLCLIGCATRSGDAVQRPATVDIDIYRDGQKPQKACRELSLLTDDGRIEEQRNIEAKMIKKAQSMGANAIIFHPLIESGGEGQPFGGWKKTFYYRASVVRYE